MDIKLKTSEMLLQKLAFGCEDAQLHAVAEIRLFSKWDDANRVSLARAGAITPLLKLLGQSTDARVQENAVTALLNMSINAENKMRMVREEGGLEAVMRVANEGSSSDAKVSATALLYSVVVDNDARRIASGNDSLWTTLLCIVRDGSANCKAEALKALFVAAGDAQIREKLLQERLQAIGLFFSIVTVGKVKLTEDCLAILALLANCPAGAGAITRTPNSISILLYLVSSGSQRAQENAVSVLLNMCQNDEEAQKMLPLRTLIPVLNDLSWGGSKRGKGKAKALLSLLGFDQPLTIPSDPNANFNSNFKASTMPFLRPTAHTHDDPPPHIQLSPHQTPSASSSTSTPFPNASWPKPLSKNKYMNFARNLFAHRPRKKSHSTIS